MSVSDWIAAVALLLVIEGLLPFAAPAAWRDGISRIAALRDGQVRFIGAVSMFAGLVLLLLFK